MDFNIILNEVKKVVPNENDIVMDFFAGSGTTGEAVMAQNAIDGGNRRYVLVQLPESLDIDSKDQKTLKYQFHLEMIQIIWREIFRVFRKRVRYK